MIIEAQGPKGEFRVDQFQGEAKFASVAASGQLIRVNIDMHA